MYLDVRYRSGDPSKITASGSMCNEEYVFTLEGSTARLVDVRSKNGVGPGESVIGLTKLSYAHDAILKLPFVDEVTVWMKGRTRTLLEDGTHPSEMDGEDA